MKKHISVLITLLIAFCLFFALYNYVKKIVSKTQINESINQVVEGEFTDIQITDGEAAIKAVKEFGPSISLTTAVDELTVQNVTKTNERTYYRLQQNYKGIPVYGCTGVVIADTNGEAQGFTANMREITEDIDLEPSVSRKEVVSKVGSYVKKHLSLDSECLITLSNTEKQNLVIYALEEVKSPILCYATTVDVNGEQYKIIIDANNGEVLNFYTLHYTNSYSFEIAGDIEKKLENKEKKIIIYSANRKTLTTSWYVLDGELNKYTLYGGNWIDSNGNVYLPDNNKGMANLQVKMVLDTKEDGDFSESDNDKKKVELLNDYSTKLYEFYEEILGRTSFNGNSGIIGIVYDDYMDGENNSISKTMGDLTILSFGINESLTPDLVAHEYTHSVEKTESGMTYSGESGAIMEGYSDVFGELFEDWHKNNMLDNDCDWIHGTRTIYNPSKNKYPEKISSNKNGGEDYVHGHSTVISHAAYLMVHGVKDKYECISTETLAQLWYNTLLTLPSDCTYSVLRDHMEMMASIMNLSEGQRECISAAFKKVGIESQNTYATDLTITTCDLSGELCSNYEIVISEVNKDSYYEEISVNKAETTNVTLEKGTYNITVRKGEKNQSKQIKVRENSENKELSFVAEFNNDVKAGDALTSYANQYTYQYGKTYDGYVNRIVEENSVFDSFEYDYSRAPQGELAYHIDDFDGDDTLELLILSFSEEYSLILKMYEQDAKGVVLQDKLDLKELNINLNHAAAHSDITPALFDVFTYGKNKTSIGIETYEHETFIGDGKELHFVSVSYDGSELDVDVNAGVSGSSGTMDMATYYIPELEKMDITPSWYKIFSRERQVYHYLENYKDIMRIETSYLCDYEKASTWMEGNSNAIKCSNIYFNSQKDLEKNTAKIKDEHSEFDKTSWKDAYIHYIEQAYAKDTTESYAYQLVYIDNNKIPELVVDYASYAEGMDVCTYSNKNKLKTIHVDYGFSYQKNKNLFMISNGRFDEFYNNVYEIKNGSFVKILSGQYGILDYSNPKKDVNGKVVYQYFIDEQEVTEMEYEKLIDKKFPESTSISPDYVGFYEIMGIIDSF